MERLAVIRLSALGDIVHTIPVLPPLLSHYPGVRISWFAEPAGSSLLQHVSGISEIVSVDVKSGSLRDKWRALQSLRQSQRQSFDLILDFQGLLKSALLAFLLPGRRVGFHRRNLREPLASLFYQQQASYIAERKHVIYKNLHLLSLLGIRADEVRYPLKALQPSAALQMFWSAVSWRPQRWLAFNVGGGWSTKVLAPAQIRETVHLLQADYPLLLLWGTDQERQLAEEISRQTGAPLVPFLSFADLICLLRETRLLISADTLALHLADMAGIPSVAVFGPTDPSRNGSLQPASVALVADLPCRFCYRRRCDTIECMKQIAPQRIVAAVRAIDAQRR